MRGRLKPNRCKKPGDQVELPRDVQVQGVVGGQEQGQVRQVVDLVRRGQQVVLDRPGTASRCVRPRRSSARRSDRSRCFGRS